jgi:hypothetical protein
MAAGFAPIITSEQRDDWEKYAVANQGWLDRSAYLKVASPAHTDALHGTINDQEHDQRELLDKQSISPFIYKWENGEKIPETIVPGDEVAPLWQISPADSISVNVNLLSNPAIRDFYNKMLNINSVVLSYDVKIGDMVSLTQTALI